MITITSVEFQRHFGRYQDEALKEPVSITRNGRERIVVLSVEGTRSRGLIRRPFFRSDLRLGLSGCDRWVA